MIGACRAVRLAFAKGSTMNRVCIPSFLLLILLTGTFAFAQSPYAMESAAPASELPKALVGLLNPQGARVSQMKNGISTPIAEVWWAKAVASHAPAAKHNSIYARLTTGGLIGVLHFIEEGEDSRDQKMQAGFYTLRYAEVEGDPEHANNGGLQEAVLATPMWADKHVDQVMKLEELLKVSRLAAKTKKPVVINLMPINPAYTDSPALITDDQGNCAVQVSTQTRPSGSSKTEDLSLSFLLVTPVREDGES